MNIPNMSRKASGALVLVLALLIVVQQYRVVTSSHNESAADRELVRLQIEVADLRMKAGVK